MVLLLEFLFLLNHLIIIIINLNLHVKPRKMPNCNLKQAAATPMVEAAVAALCFIWLRCYLNFALPFFQAINYNSLRYVFTGRRICLVGFARISSLVSPISFGV
ncbi:uncharacterized protein LOC132630024 isoform X2 [Lycium barbarum]|uniref:uncharacterized protein LOC132630024 isoform X2 n=1 Tax=Lycium barbarum TaxID=112863 RepID=UPI00293E6CEC|nr:uncharacterized protein LOC132630024 isoform X2 [Lycium barbarum]